MSDLNWGGGLKNHQVVEELREGSTMSCHG